MNLGPGSRIETEVGTLVVTSQISQGLNGFLYALDIVGCDKTFTAGAMNSEGRGKDEVSPIIEPFLLKIPVGQMDIYTRLFKFEIETLALCRKMKLPVQPAVLVKKDCIIKKFTRGRLFNELYLTGDLGSQARCDFEQLRKKAQQLFIDYGIPLDISPDNLIWNGSRWLIMDTAPPALKERCPEWILQSDWETYLDYYQPVMLKSEFGSWISYVHQDIESKKFERHIYIEKLKSWFPLAEYDPEEFYYPVSMSYGEMCANIHSLKLE